jgi:hypothetical protein
VTEGKQAPSTALLSPGGGSSVEERAEQLRRGAEAMLDALGLQALLREFGEVAMMGSLVSDLMTHPEVDIGVHVGEDFSLADAARVAGRLAEAAPCRRLVIDDQRGGASPGERRDERFHLVLECPHEGREWTLDISLFLHDAHANVAAWHRQLRSSLTLSQRLSILTIKSALCHDPAYPGGLSIYTAVLEKGVRTVEEYRSTDRTPPRDA